MVIFHSYVSLPEGTTFEIVRVHGVPLESNRLEKPCSERPDCHCCWSSLYHIRVCHNTWCINRPFADIPIYFFKMPGAASPSLSRDWRTRARKCFRGIVRHQEHQPVGCRNLGPGFYIYYSIVQCVSIHHLKTSRLKTSPSSPGILQRYRTAILFKLWQNEILNCKSATADGQKQQTVGFLHRACFRTRVIFLEMKNKALALAVLQLLSIEHCNSMVQGPRVKSGPKSKNYFAPGGVGSGPASMGRSPQKMALSDMLLLPAPSLMVTHHPWFISFDGKVWSFVA